MIYNTSYHSVTYKIPIPNIIENTNSIRQAVEKYSVMIDLANMFYSVPLFKFFLKIFLFLF